MTDAPLRRQVRNVVFPLAAVCAFLASWYAGTAMTPGPPPAADEKAACWVLADMDSFFCGPCLEHLLAFFRAVPARVQEDRVRGILVFGAGRTAEDTRRRGEIVRTKWRGFSRANGIRVPASVDADGWASASSSSIPKRGRCAAFRCPCRPGHLRRSSGFL
jgi:hypothetical protein